MKILMRLLSLIILLSLIWLAAGCTFQIIQPAAPESITLISVHERYVTALGEQGRWAVSQEQTLSPCTRFEMAHLANGKVTLRTCQGKYVAAPRNGAESSDWMLQQAASPGDCGQFDLYELGEHRVAFKTCAGRFWTAGNGDWESSLAWSVIAETEKLSSWEIFLMTPAP